MQRQFVFNEISFYPVGGLETVNPRNNKRLQINLKCGTHFVIDYFQHEH